MIDRQTAQALALLNESSAQIRRELDHLTTLLDQQQELISALHDRAVNECPLFLVKDTGARASVGFF